ncbi:MAG: LysR family transcriptional regulator, partial [Bacteriovoracaceae bacterium]
MNLKDINWNQIYYFYEVARKQSLKKAAKVLNVSSATLSEHIKKLEKTLGFDLFHRNHKGLALTKEGENLFDYSKDMFETGLRMVDSISTSSLGGYPVKVGVLDTVSDLKSLQFVSQYYDTYAPYGIVHTGRQYNSEKLLDSLLQGQFDWIITTSRPKGKMIDSAEIDKFTISFCCSKILVDRFKDYKDIFKAVPLALNNWDHKLNKNVIKHLQDHDVKVEEILETDHRELALMLAERGRCVT